MTEPDWLAEGFEKNRTRLRAVAYRMLGSLAAGDGGNAVVRGETGEQTDQESRSAGPRAASRLFLLDAVRHGRACTGGNDERKEGHAEVRQEHHRDRQEVQGIHGRGTGRDEGARQRAEG